MRWIQFGIIFLLSVAIGKEVILAETMGNETLVPPVESREPFTYLVIASGWNAVAAGIVILMLEPLIRQIIGWLRH